MIVNITKPYLGKPGGSSLAITVVAANNYLGRGDPSCVRSGVLHTLTVAAVGTSLWN